MASIEGLDLTKDDFETLRRCITTSVYQYCVKLAGRARGEYNQVFSEFKEIFERIESCNPMLRKNGNNVQISSELRQKLRDLESKVLGDESSS